MITKSQEIEERTVERIADLMCVAARTAPKARGVDNLVVMLVKTGEKDQLAEEMRRIAAQSGTQFFARDAGCLDKAAAVVLLGQKVKPVGVNPCGYCGNSNCADCGTKGGLCAISIGDLGIAIGSAVTTAALHHIDNRVMWTVGKAALNLGIFPEEVKIAYGIPLSIAGKNIFFDRG
jgi:uncharacterized ferredoxin-like protein